MKQNIFTSTALNIEDVLKNPRFFLMEPYNIKLTGTSPACSTMYSTLVITKYCFTTTDTNIFVTNRISNILVHVTGVAVVDEEYTEVDSFEISRSISVEPSKPYNLDAMFDSTFPERSFSEYFCLNEGVDEQDFEEVLILKKHNEGVKGELWNSKLFKAV